MNDEDDYVKMIETIKTTKHTMVLLLTFLLYVPIGTILYFKNSFITIYLILFICLLFCILSRITGVLMVHKYKKNELKEASKVFFLVTIFSGIGVGSALVFFFITCILTLTR